MRSAQVYDEKGHGTKDFFLIFDSKEIKIIYEALKEHAESHPKRKEPKRLLAEFENAPIF